MFVSFLGHFMQVLFVCTANVVDMIPNPLLDRMEVIAIAGYITDEKMNIARNYLEKTTREACGIKPEQVSLSHKWLCNNFFFLICYQSWCCLLGQKESVWFEPVIKFFICFLLLLVHFDRECIFGHFQMQFLALRNYACCRGHFMIQTLSWSF